MTPDEQKEFSQMKEDISAILEKVDEQSILNHSILRAIKGDDMGNPGITARLSNVEREINEMKMMDLKTGNFVLVIDEMKRQNLEMQAQLTMLKEERLKNSPYFKILTFMGSAVALAIIAYLMKNLLHPPAVAAKVGYVASLFM